MIPHRLSGGKDKGKPFFLVPLVQPVYFAASHTKTEPRRASVSCRKRSVSGSRGLACIRIFGHTSKRCCLGVAAKSQLFRSDF